MRWLGSEFRAIRSFVGHHKLELSITKLRTLTSAHRARLSLSPAAYELTSSMCRVFVLPTRIPHQRLTTHSDHLVSLDPSALVFLPSISAR